MKLVHSMMVAFDGEAKCGKTTIINNVAAEAAYQADIIPSLLNGEGGWEKEIVEHVRPSLTELHESLAFNSISTVSAGNMFRAATLYVMSEEQDGRSKSEFNSDDVPVLRGLLDTEGIHEILQQDASIGRRVSSVAQMVGVQALCGALFCDAVLGAYNKDTGGNLVIADARDPIGHMQCNNIIGNISGKVHPGSILPIYIDTPVEVAAARLAGDTKANIAEIAARRLLDTAREELPVVKPSNAVRDFSEWARQFSSPTSRSEVAAPLWFDNGEGVNLENVQWCAGFIAMAAQDVGCFIRQDTAAAQV